TDPGFAGDQHDLTGAVGCAPPAVEHQVELALATDWRWQVREGAVVRKRAVHFRHDAVHPHRPRPSARRRNPELFAVEGAAPDPGGVGGDDDPVSGGALPGPRGDARDSARERPAPPAPR